MNHTLSRKAFLRLGTATAVTTGVATYLSACGGGGGGTATAATAGTAGTASGASASTLSGSTQETIAAPVSNQPASTLPAATFLWSDPATWGGTVPRATDPVTIAGGVSIRLDTAAVCLSLDIQGSLIADQTVDVSITTGNINIGPAGVLAIGSEATPYTRNAVITLNGAEVGRTLRTGVSPGGGYTNSGVGRSLRVQPGGRLSLIGRAPTIRRTRLNANAAAGARSFSLADATGWKSGDEIAFGTTDFFGVAQAEKLVLAASASGTTITTTAGLAAARWGALQYVTDTGMSLTPGGFSNAPAGASTVIDERAFVINLTRNIVVQGANDAAWTANRFGAHCMFMGITSDVKIDGVQFRRVGQAGAMGRYPLHWHMASYNMPNGMDAPSDGQFKGAFATGTQYVKNCAISESSQRMITIHGTHGVTVDSNVGFDITGHGIFLEDGSEQNNNIYNNVVMKIRAPTTANRLIASDIASGIDYGAPGCNDMSGVAGIWFTNPNNALVGNWVSDSAGCGIWNSFATQCFGLSVSVPVVPQSFAFQNWQQNTAMGCAGSGALTAFPVVSNFSEVGDDFYPGGKLDHPLTNLMAFKNSGGGYFNRIVTARYEGFTLADNAGMDVSGASKDNLSLANGFLSVAESLNNSNSKYLSSKRAAFATYHEFLNFKNTTLVGYGFQDGVQIYHQDSPIGGGIFRMQDLYMSPLLTFYANTGLRQVNCGAPFRARPPNLDGFPLQVDQTAGYRNWTVAGAIRDDNGIFVPRTSSGAPSYWVHDDPFLTWGASNLQDVAPARSGAVPLGNGKYTPDRYFGVGTFDHTNNSRGVYNCWLPLQVTRQDANGATVGNWTVGDGASAVMLGNMRHFAAHNGGRFALSFPGNIATNLVYFEVTGMIYGAASSDSFLLGVEFNGNPATTRVIQSAGGFGSYSGNIPNVPGASEVSAGTARVLSRGSSMADVTNDSTGTVFWQDSANKMVWFKVKVSSLAAAASWWSAEALAYKSVSVAVIA